MSKKTEQVYLNHFYTKQLQKGSVERETNALIHPGLQGSCGDLVFLSVKD